MKLMLEKHARIVSNHFFLFRVRIFKNFVKKLEVERRTGDVSVSALFFFLFRFSSNFLIMMMNDGMIYRLKVILMKCMMYDSAYVVYW